MHVRILEFYKNLKVEIEIAELNLILLKDKEKYLSSLVDKSKKKNIQNDIRATQIYINDLKNICHTLGKKVVEMIYINATNKEKIVFKDYILLEKSAKEIIEEYPKENFSAPVIYNIANKINSILAKIKVNDNNIFNILMKNKCVKTSCD